MAGLKELDVFSGVKLAGIVSMKANGIVIRLMGSSARRLIDLRSSRYPFLPTTYRLLSRLAMTPEHAVCPNACMVGLLTFL